MVNYACAFSQSESGKYFEWVVIHHNQLITGEYLRSWTTLNVTIKDAESKFGTHKELIVGNILEYKHCVNKSRGMSRDHLAKNRKLLWNWWPV